jgi:hypothetical protein
VIGSLVAVLFRGWLICFFDGLYWKYIFLAAACDLSSTINPNSSGQGFAVGETVVRCLSID